MTKLQTADDLMLASLGLNADEIANLSPVERAYVLKSLDELAVDGQSSTVTALLMEDYKWEPVSMTQFLSDPFYMGHPDLTGSLFPEVKKALIDTFDAEVRPTELILAGSLGWGKSTLAAVSLVYLAHRLTCMRNPHNYYGLMPGAPVIMGIYSISMEQALETTYGKLIQWFDRIPYFIQRCPRIKRINSVIKFSGCPLQIIAGSKEAHTIGRDMLAFFLDEANFMTTPGGDIDDGVAVGIYNNATRRIKTRFMTKRGEPAGMAILGSSKRTKASFLEQHIKESANDIAAGRTKVFAFAQWEVRPPEYYTKPKFTVEIGDRMHPSRILRDGEQPRQGAETRRVPGEFLIDFENDCDKALRDLAGVASESMAPLFHNRKVIHDCCDAEHVHPFTRSEISIDIMEDIGIDAYFSPDVAMRIVQSRYELRVNPQHGRYVHVDIGLTGDSLGLCMLHIAGFKTVRRNRKDGTWYEDKAPHVVVDLVLRVKPPKGSEIDLAKTRGFILSLRDMGVPIERVSYDGHQSRESVQAFKKLGIHADVISVDKNDEAYLMLRQGMVERRVSMYHYPKLVEELELLERDLDARKVDHPKNGSKDVADALCGSYYNAMMDKRVLLTGVPQVTTRTNVATKVDVPGGSMLWAHLDKEANR
jgi:hypothetical protein